VARPGRRRIVVVVVGIAFVASVFLFFLPKIADYRDVVDVVRDLGFEDWLVLLAATAFNVVTYAPPWMAALPGLRFRQAFVMSQASTALGVVAPAGAAVSIAGSFAMLRGWGFRSGPVGVAVAVTGVWNQLANLLWPVLGLAALTIAGGGDRDRLLHTVALIASIVLVVVLTGFGIALSSKRRAAQIGDLAARLVNRVLRIVRRGPVTWDGSALLSFRGRTLDILRRRALPLTLAVLVGQFAVFLVLLVCLRTLGVGADDVSTVEAFAAWSLVRLLGSVSFTPGGLGLVELGLAGALVGFGASNADAVAATLLYRFLTMVPTLLLGLLFAATWRRHHPGGTLEGDAPLPNP
jgi:uncharacterized protein (TIRG00374 family)